MIGAVSPDMLGAVSIVSPLGSAIAMLVPQCERRRAGDIRTASNVELERFAGDWFVIASIPTPIDRDACNARERYAIGKDGRIDATYRFRKGRADGRLWTIRRTGVVRNARSNAIWDIRLAGPIAADYRIVYVDENYSQAIIGRNRRDYAWILARDHEIGHRELFQHVRRLREQGYDSSRLRTVPQHWNLSPTRS